MRKSKLMYGTILLAAALGICACGSRGNSNVENGSSGTVNETSQEESQEISSEISDKAEEPVNTEYQLSVEDEEYTEGLILIQYPQAVISEADASEETNAVLAKANEMIKEDALKILEIFEINSASDTVTISQESFIDGDGRISVKFVADVMINEAAHPTTYIYTSNIDLYTAERFKPVSDETISEIGLNFEPGVDYEIVEEEVELKDAIESYLYEYDIELVASSLSRMDFSDEYDIPLCYSYIDTDGTYITIDVPSALGQTAVLRILK